ncbi:MAG: alpha/beta hydrolase family protein [Candidatus Levyibacteriota bacterium]
MKFFVILLLILLSAGGVVFLSYKKPGLLPIKQLPHISVTPVPYENLTIPFLRQKQYPATLGSLVEDYAGSGFTAYLTSYTSEGLKVNALLTKPSGDIPKGGWPAIIFIHGYIPPATYQTDGEAYSAYVDYLADQGFVVFKIDLRGNGNSEGRPGGGYYGADYVTDALSAYTALQSSGFVNPKEIGLWGHSMAGNTVLRSFAAKPDIPAVVIWAGAVYSYVDQQKYGIHDSSYRPPEVSPGPFNTRRLLFDKVGSPSAGSPFWQQMAPTNYLSDLKGAIEIHHAKDDNVVNIGYSRDLVSLLDKTGVPHEYYEYETGGHNISGASFDLAMQRTVDFFNKYLKHE